MNTEHELTDSPDTRTGEPSEPGWWHPEACTNTHDEGGNCLDLDGSIIGWRDFLTPATGTEGYESCDMTHQRGTTHYHPARVAGLIKERDATPATGTEGLDVRLRAVIDEWYRNDELTFAASLRGDSDSADRLTADLAAALGTPR